MPQPSRLSLRTLALPPPLPPLCILLRALFVRYAVLDSLLMPDSTDPVHLDNNA